MHWQDVPDSACASRRRTRLPCPAPLPFGRSAGRKSDWPMAKPMEYTQGDILFINEVPFMQPLFDTCAELFKAHRYTVASAG